MDFLSLSGDPVQGPATGQGISGSPGDKLSVAIALLFSAVFLGEVLTWKASHGAILIISGTLVLIL